MAQFDTTAAVQLWARPCAAAGSVRLSSRGRLRHSPLGVGPAVVGWCCLIPVRIHVKKSLSRPEFKLMEPDCQMPNLGLNWHLLTRAKFRKSCRKAAYHTEIAAPFQFK